MGSRWCERPLLIDNEGCAGHADCWGSRTWALAMASLALVSGGRHASRVRGCWQRRRAEPRCRTVRTAATAGQEGAARRVLVPVAQDSEEIETACITDVLVRAGAEVTVASVEETLQVRMSRGLNVVADVLIAECKGQQWDAIVCPGGMPGAERLRDSTDLTTLLKEQHSSGRITAAVCAAPAIVFGAHGLLGDKATSYPAPKFKEIVGLSWMDAKAVVDGNVITSQGPGTSLQFALKIVEEMYGLAKAEELAAQMVTQLA